MELGWKSPPVLDMTLPPAPTPHTPPTDRGSHRFKFVQGRAARRRKNPLLPREGTSAGAFSKFRLNIQVASREKGLSPNHVAAASTDASDKPQYQEPHRNTVADAGLINVPGPRKSETCHSDIPQSRKGVRSPSIPDWWDLLHECPASDFDTQISRTTAIQPQPHLQHYSWSRGCCKSNNSINILEPPLALSSGVLYRSLAHKYSVMFSMFNDEFCVVPLSTDCLDNPFRAREDFAESYNFLSHAVMALTSHHLSKRTESTVLRRETQAHWSTALQSLSTALSRTGILPLLDTILLLINFESTQSAFGMLNMHLGGAKSLLEQQGAMEIFARSSRMRAQVAMLIWWDVTSALTSRSRPRLVDPYLDSLKEFNQRDDWSFFTLAGCPTAFVVAMARLAALAHRHERLSARQRNIPDADLQLILDEVRSYNHICELVCCLSYTHSNSAGTDGALNRRYCIEAWRHAILLYTLRVFSTNQTNQDLSSISYHARMILDSARCIPPTEPFQKQVLLPVFLAGAEVDDEFNRSFVRTYCQHWSKVCNFDQFSGALALLEGIWNDWTPDNRGLHWWGVKIGNGGESVHAEGDNELQKQLLLG